MDLVELKRVLLQQYCTILLQSVSFYFYSTISQNPKHNNKKERKEKKKNSLQKPKQNEASTQASL